MQMFVMVSVQGLYAYPEIIVRGLGTVNVIDAGRRNRY